MTKKNATKTLARAQQRKYGGSYQHHLRQAGGADGATKVNGGGFIEVLVFDEKGQQCLGIVTFVPPGLPNGAPDPSEGLIMGGIPDLKAGRYVLVEPTGRARHVIAERSAGGGGFMAVIRAPDRFVTLELIYSSLEFNHHGMPVTYARYKILPQRDPETSIYALGILSLTSEATVSGVEAFGWQAWAELFALLGTTHPQLHRRAMIDPGPVHEQDCPLHGWNEAPGAPKPQCECLGVDASTPLLDGDDHYDI